jgi:glutathione S-transferase
MLRGCRYVGRLGTGSLYPSTPLEELRMNEIIGLSEDLDGAFKPSLYMSMRPADFGMPEDYAKTDAGKEHIRSLRVKFAAEKLPVFLTHLQTALAASGGGFFGGEAPSLADCQILPQMAKFQAGFIDHIPTSVLDGHPAIIEWMARMRAIPEVAEWYSKK